MVLHGHAQRPHQRTIRFAREQHSLPDGAGRTIDALARTLARVGLWNRPTACRCRPSPSPATATARRPAPESAPRPSARRSVPSWPGSWPTPAGHHRNTLAVRDFGLTLDAKRVRGATDPDTGAR
ncbi:hypothetical protein ACFQV4_29295 [Streptomyces thermocarboxydus]